MEISDGEGRAKVYTANCGRSIVKMLGFGNDGSVWQTDKTTAVKACDDVARYSTELRCYLILRDHGITEIKGYAVPQLINYNDYLRIIEMTVVTPPYIIDFGKAYLQNHPPAFSRETMADWYAEKKELYGDYWPEVQSILGKLRSIGIHHMDPKPGNILPANWDPPID